VLVEWKQYETWVQHLLEKAVEDKKIAFLEQEVVRMLEDPFLEEVVVQDPVGLVGIVVVVIHRLVAVFGNDVVLVHTAFASSDILVVAVDRTTVVELILVVAEPVVIVVQNSRKLWRSQCPVLEWEEVQSHPLALTNPSWKMEQVVEPRNIHSHP